MESKQSWRRGWIKGVYGGFVCHIIIDWWSLFDLFTWVFRDIVAGHPFKSVAVVVPLDKVAATNERDRRRTGKLAVCWNCVLFIVLLIPFIHWHTLFWPWKIIPVAAGEKEVPQSILKPPVMSVNLKDLFFYCPANGCRRFLRSNVPFVWIFYTRSDLISFTRQNPAQIQYLPRPKPRLIPCPNVILWPKMLHCYLCGWKNHFRTDLLCICVAD